LKPGERGDLKARLRVDREPEPRWRWLSLHVGPDGLIPQTTTVVATNPLVPRVHAPTGGKLPVSVGNPSGGPFRGRPLLRKYDRPGGWRVASQASIDLPAGVTHALVSLPVEAETVLTGGVFRLRLVDEEGRRHYETPYARLGVVDDFARHTPETLAKAYRLAGDGAVHYPIRLDTLLLIDKDRGRPGKGAVYIASPTLLY